MGKGDKGGKDGYPDGRGWYEKGEKGQKGEKGERGEKGSEKGGKGGGKDRARQKKLVERGLRGRIVSFMNGRPSGFIKRGDGGKKDVYFDFVDVLDEEEVKVGDPVEFDVVEGTDGRLYGSSIKKLPKDTPLTDDKQSLKMSSSITASTAGSLTGGGKTLGPSKPGKLTGGLSLRPGGALTLGPGGSTNTFLGPTPKKEEPKPSYDDAASRNDSDVAGLLWGRVTSIHSGFAFLQPLPTNEDDPDVFFRAGDVVGINCNDPGQDGVGLQITPPSSRHSGGHKSFWLAADDEVSYFLSKDQNGKDRAVNVRKERKGAWRMGRDTSTTHKAPPPRVLLRDQVERLTEMSADEVLQNISLFKEVLDNPNFEPSFLINIVQLLAWDDLSEDMRSDRLYHLFLESRTIQTELRTCIIKHAQGGSKHSGTFVEDCLRVLTEIVVRSTVPQELRGQLPLSEVIEALEAGIRDGSSSTRKGLPEDVVQMLLCLQKHFPDEVNLDKLLGTRAPKVQRSAADEYTELLEADYYQDMPILPTSAEMLGQCAFEIEENMRTYERCEDYIQTHFMLLREDYIEPLRAGIKLFMQGKHSPKDLHVYTGVKVVGVLSTMDGLVYRIELSKSQVRRINWEKTKQLMYGSLLCLSDDNFNTLIWATVWRRDESLIATEAQLDIRLPFEPFDDRLCPGKQFSCIENVTIYFEAYRYVLIAMQNMRPTDLPFQNTLLSPMPDAKHPGFLRADNDMFHFHNVFATCHKENSKVSAPKSFKILQEWPETLREALDIDPSQLDAIQHALTHQVALVQGPPGTGKTWVGLKIVQALLDNTKNYLNSPILVVCYTNHALDQFLEGIFKFCERIARIGSRSKSELMKERNLKELVNEREASWNYRQARRALMERRDALRIELARVLKDIDRHQVCLDDARNLMSDKQFFRFFEGYVDFLGGDTKGLPVDADDIEDDLWEKMLKAWLDVSGDLTKLAAPLISPANSSAKRVANALDVETDTKLGDWEELVNDDEEGEADAMRYDRRLDVEGGDEKKKPQDFFGELKNAWLPPLEAHLERLSPEARGLNWRDEDLWRLPISLRRVAYRQWLLEAHHEARQLLPELAQQLERNAEHRAALERDRKLSVLKEMEVVGMTTTAVSKFQLLLKELRPEVIIVEEAAEVLEAHILTALHPKTQHVILIGDHQQLRPSTAVYRLSKHFHLDVSLFERLIKNGADHVTLLQQRRMHPKVSRLIKPLYPALRDHPSVNNYPDIMGVNARCFFLKHNHYEDEEGESHSKSNTFEANFISAFVAHLVKSGYEESQITVLSPYLGQVRLLKNKLRRDSTTENVQITAVDNFQGEENDIIVISLVRSNRTRSMGFLAVENRINVALTRARHGMFIVGNADMLKDHNLWGQIIRELGTDRSIGEQLPLLDPVSGEVFPVRSADEISILLDNPLHEAGDAGSPGQGTKPTADRWAGLGKEDTDGKGRTRGYRDRDRGNGRGGGPPANDWNGNHSWKGGGDAGRSRRKGSGKDGDWDRDRGYDRWDDRYNGGKRNERDNDKDWSSAQKDRYEDDGKRRNAPARPNVQAPKPEKEKTPLPTKMEADDLHDECELVCGKAAAVEDDGASAKKGKKKQKSGKTVLMRLG